MVREENCNLAQVEIDEMFRLVRYVTAEIPAHDAVPSGVLSPYLLDVCGNILLYVVLLHGLRGAVHSILLHVLGHVRILDHSLPVRHVEPVAKGPLASKQVFRLKTTEAQ
uniref:Dynein light chain n=1 Tax=Varanus komodoensis TaxID=61221 RepID=A0A8D2LUH8_VARKO